MSGSTRSGTGPKSRLVAQREGARHHARPGSRAGCSSSSSHRHRRPGRRGRPPGRSRSRRWSSRTCTAPAWPWTSRTRPCRASAGFDLERGPADGGHERAARRVVRSRKPGVGEVVPVVTAREQDADAGGVGEHERVVERGLGGRVREEVTEGVAPRVADDGGAAGDRGLQGGEQARCPGSPAPRRRGCPLRVPWRARPPRRGPARRTSRSHRTPPGRRPWRGAG